MTTYLRHVSTIYANLTALYSIGQSVQGRELWVMVVSSSPYEHMIGKPNVKYVANMHGNEVRNNHYSPKYQSFAILKPGTWHLTPGTWHLAPGTWHK